MKVKLKEVLKLVIVLIGFVTIYSGLTIIDRNWYSDKVNEMQDEFQELDVKLTEFSNDVLTDTVYVKQLTEYNIDSLQLAINSYISGNDSLIYMFTDKLFKDSTITLTYMSNLENIRDEHNEFISNMEDYVLYHNRLVTRFPSNLVVGNYSLINNK